MNTLIVSPYNARSISGPIMLDQLCDAMENAESTDTIYFLSCLNSFDLCYYNYGRSPATCFRCRVGISRAIERVVGDYIALRFDDIICDSDVAASNLFFTSGPELRIGTCYENFEIGEALFSVYVSQTRNRDERAAMNSAYIKVAKTNALVLYLAMRRFLRDNAIDEVRSFNGRQDYSRAILRASEAESVECRNYERTRPGGYVEYYVNTIPHDIAARTAWIEAAWNGGDADGVDKEAVAREYYENKRAGRAVVDRSFTLDQVRNLLPSVATDASVVSVFTSSDDEFAAVGAAYRNPFFADQVDGIRYLVQLFGRFLSDRALVVRMHPNLSGVDESYVHDIRTLDRAYPNVFVLAPDDPCDSYALMDASEKVVVFGSSIGIEASYWRKPVILLGKSFYWNLNVAYTPVSRAEIPALLSSILRPRPITGALKYGYYAMRGGVKSTHYYQSAPYARSTFAGRQTVDLNILARVMAKLVDVAHRRLGIRLRIQWYRQRPHEGSIMCNVARSLGRLARARLKSLGRMGRRLG